MRDASCSCRRPTPRSGWCSAWPSRHPRARPDPGGQAEPDRPGERRRPDHRGRHVATSRQGREVQGLRVRPRSSPASRASRTADEFETNAGVLRRLIGRTAFATAVENSRYAINGVLLQRTGRNLDGATDGRRLAVAGRVQQSTDEDSALDRADQGGQRAESTDERSRRTGPGRRDRNQIVFQVGEGPRPPSLEQPLRGSFLRSRT